MFQISVVIVIYNNYYFLNSPKPVVGTFGRDFLSSDEGRFS